ncbi:nucleoside deaminase [Dactylosporangium sp. CA-139066]|uniref:nucleoside deaminase n=1 Tax=Dactylosporangium sp. CA-139066 TaxID=3239930 RepID=UPI003D911DD4
MTPGGPWRACFELAWASFVAGSIPVGAVLVAPGGDIVARGRNRRAEPGGSNIAHAEIGALLHLPPGHYPEHILYSTLEPCLLCTAAIRHSHVGTARFAAPDPMWRGVEGVPALNAHLARGWPRLEGPQGGPLETFSSVMHLTAALERDAGWLLSAYDGSPALATARRFTAAGLRSLSFDEAWAVVTTPGE